MGIDRNLKINVHVGIDVVEAEDSLMRQHFLVRRRLGIKVGTGMDLRGLMKITGKRSVTWEGVRDRGMGHGRSQTVGRG